MAGRREQSPLRALLAARAGRVLAGVAAALALATIIAMVLLWPSPDPTAESQAFGGRATAAVAVEVRTSECGPTGQACRTLVVQIDEGPDKGDRETLELGPVEAVQSVSVGQKVRVTKIEGAPAGSPRYSFSDAERRTPLRVLFITFAVVGVLVAGRQGALALIGLGASLLLVTIFLVPAILDGGPPVLVSIVAGMAVMFVTLGLTYGVSAQSLAAATGIGSCLLLAAVGGQIALSAAHLDGRGGELYPLLAQAGAGDLSLSGIVLAGMVIGALGVLTDTAVTQASAVMALRRANPALGARALYRGGFSVGRDHLAATIHTLVMAYVGTLLPLLLVLEAADVAVGDAINGQFLAEPLVATLIGSMALMTSVPLTTALAAVLAVRVPAEAIDAHHGHAH